MLSRLSMLMVQLAKLAQLAGSGTSSVPAPSLNPGFIMCLQGSAVLPQIVRQGLCLLELGA